jgi:RHH-type rel operon transcriptional repressor/antitoxin RelB
MPISIQLNAETERRLDFLVTQTGRSKADYLREMIENGLDDLEDCYLATEVLARVRGGTEKVHSAGDVRKELGLDD